MKTVLLLILTSIILCSCVSDNQKEIHNRIIDIGEGYDSYQNSPLSEFSKRVEYLNLETCQESLIQDISSIEITSDYIFLSSGRQKALLFTRGGEFDHKIGNLGRGPFEFVQIKDILLDSQSRFALILDKAQKKIIKYYITSGRYEEFSLENNIDQMVQIDNSHFALFIAIDYVHEHSDHQVLIVDSVFSTVLKLARNTLWKKYNNISERLSSIYTIEDTLVFWNRFGDTLYSYTRDGDQTTMVSKTAIVNSNNTFPLGEFIDIRLNDRRYQHNFFDRYFDMKNHIIIRGNKLRDIWYMVYDKTSCKTYSINVNYNNGFGILNDMDDGPNFYPKFRVNDSTMVSAIEPASLLFTKPEMIENCKSEQLKNILTGIDALSNPILQLITTK